MDENQLAKYLKDNLRISMSTEGFISAHDERAYGFHIEITLLLNNEEIDRVSKWVYLN